MEIITTVAALRARLKSESSIAFVPTMGNLHAGHIALVHLAAKQAPCVVVSIFVNPLQFGPNEDLASYPRTLDQDCEKLEAAGTHILFAPSETEMYPDYDSATRSSGQSMTINPPPIANALCGASRPGHFDGVATVVLKLFNLVKPQYAVFGKKDFQQLAIIRELVRQFNLDITIIAGETQRDANGLALSSRNGYLTAAEREQAPMLQHTLQTIAKQLKNGERDYAKLCTEASATLNAQGWLVDYIEIRESNTLLPAKADDKALVILAAAKLGKPRLIDNLEVLI